MLDEGQFMPVRTADHPPLNLSGGEGNHNNNHNTAYPQLWGGQFEAAPYVPVAQQVRNAHPLHNTKILFSYIARFFSLFIEQFSNDSGIRSALEPSAV